MANRYCLPMWCIIHVVILGIIQSGQTLECHWCIGESCNQVTKDTQIINCTEVNSNPLNPGNVTDDGNGGTGGNNIDSNSNGTNTNGNGTDPNGNDTNSNGNSTETTNSTNNGNNTNTNGNITFGISLDDNDFGYDEDDVESRPKRNAPDFYADPVYRCLKVVTSDKKNTMRRCAISTMAHNATDACTRYSNLNTTQVSCYLCDQDRCNSAYTLKASVTSGLVVSSLLIYLSL